MLGEFLEEALLLPLTTAQPDPLKVKHSSMDCIKSYIEPSRVVDDDRVGRSASITNIDTEL